MEILDIVSAGSPISPEAAEMYQWSWKEYKEDKYLSAEDAKSYYVSGNVWEWVISESTYKNLTQLPFKDCAYILLNLDILISAIRLNEVSLDTHQGTSRNDNEWILNCRNHKIHFRIDEVPHKTHGKVSRVVVI